MPSKKGSKNSPKRKSRQSIDSDDLKGPALFYTDKWLEILQSQEADFFAYEVTNDLVAKAERRIKKEQLKHELVCYVVKSFCGAWLRAVRWRWSEGGRARQPCWQGDPEKAPVMRDSWLSHEYRGLEMEVPPPRVPPPLPLPLPPPVIPTPASRDENIKVKQRSMFSSRLRESVELSAQSVPPPPTPVRLVTGPTVKEREVSAFPARVEVSIGLIRRLNPPLREDATSKTVIVIKNPTPLSSLTLL